MTDREFDELHGGRELLPIEQEIYEQEGAERFKRFHGVRLAKLLPHAAQRAAKAAQGDGHG
uniref:hypothetical protein n=1 Tax=Comamonas testosteroni TaxID=285 RepID=UPI0015F79BAF|nr:hypothetical protein [Comamonas testosteroni]